MIRTILTPKHTDVHFSIPETYVGKPLEITFLSLDELNQQIPRSMGDFFGLLSEKTHQQLKNHTEQARSEWNRNF